MPNSSRMFCLLFLTALQVIAAPVTWTLSGVAFQGGGGATGSFVYDADTNTYSSVNITTSTSSPFGATYQFISTFFSSAYGVFITQGSGNLTGTPAFELVFSSPLTNAGGTITLNTESEETSCADATCTGPSGAARHVGAGSVTTSAGIPPTPAPPAWILVLTGLLLAALYMKWESGRRVLS